MIRVLHDPALSARIVSRVPLRYAAGADSSLDRPAHVRAASALGWINGRLAIIQDDANFIALVDPRTANPTAEPLTLPAGAGGVRQFGDDRGNKAAKLDLESSITFSEGHGGGSVTTLVAFGSGSTPARERIVVVRFSSASLPAIELLPAHAFYKALGAAAEFAGTELNVEGAVLTPAGELRLLGRGNGAPRDGRHPVNAMCAVDWHALWQHLQDGSHPAPRPHSIQRFDLGTIDGVPLSFTDAISWGRGLLFSAAAEASPDAVRDGPVAGSAIGVIASDGSARCAVVMDPDGQPFAGKVEGIAAGSGPHTLYAVADEDDPARPSELCILALEGEWGSGHRR